MWRQAFRNGLGSFTAGGGAARAAASGGPVTIYRTRIKPRRGPVRRAVATGLTACVCFYVWGFVALLPLRNLEPLPPDEDGDKEEVEPVFLPFPFTEEQVQPLPYAGAGEEWQGFIKFSKDVKLRDRVKDDLANMVKKAAEKNPYTSRWTQKGEGFQMGPTWLIITFPERPPPEFTRWGLEWNTEGLFLKRQKVDPRTKALLDRVLKPYAVASASYAFVKTMVMQDVSTVAQYFGFSPAGKEFSNSSPDSDIEKTIKKLEARQTANGGTTSSASPSSGASTSAAEPTSGTSAARQAVTTNNAGHRDNEKDSENGSSRNDLIPYYDTWLDKSSGPWAASMEAWKRKWKPLRYYPPRGSLAVHGMVALDSPKGRLFFDVFAWYHPKTDTFHQDSLVMGMRSVSPHGQRPRR